MIVQILQYVFILCLILCLFEAALLETVKELRELFYVIEQPISSVLFEVPDVKNAVNTLGLVCVTTWLGLFGHILLKNTKLYTNLPERSQFLGACLRWNC